MAVQVLEGRITFAAAAETVDVKTRVRAVLWTGAANDDVLLLDDQNDNEIVGATAETGNLEMYWYLGEEGIPVTTLTVTTMGGGRLVVYTS